MASTGGQTITLRGLTHDCRRNTRTLKVPKSTEEEEEEERERERERRRRKKKESAPIGAA